MGLFGSKAVPDDHAARVKELIAEVDAEEAAAAAAEPIGQGDQQWAVRRRITKAEAEAIKRQMIGPWRRHFTLSERMEFLQMYKVIVEEPMPIPTSQTHHAEILAERARRAVAPPQQPQRKPNRLIAATKVLLGVEAPVAEATPPEAEPPKHKTFFT